jgi:hypothetical protein
METDRLRLLQLRDDDDATILANASTPKVTNFRKKTLSPIGEPAAESSLPQREKIDAAVAPRCTPTTTNIRSQKRFNLDLGVWIKCQLRSNSLTKTFELKRALQTICIEAQSTSTEIGRALFDPLNLSSFAQVYKSHNSNRAKDETNESTATNSGASVRHLSNKSPASRTPTCNNKFVIDTAFSKDKPLNSAFTTSSEGSHLKYTTFYPLELEYEPWQDLQECPRILSNEQMQQIRQALPDAYVDNKWDRCFAIGRDGDSMISYLEKCSHQNTILCILTTRGEVLGGFVTESWNSPRSDYFGTGHSFLFASHPGNDDEHRDEKANQDGALQIYRWTGDNDYCQICNPVLNRLAMGGQGQFGLIVQDYFEFGHSGRCRTFENPPLVAGGHFEIAALEVYGIVPMSGVNITSPILSRRGVASSMTL